MIINHKMRRRGRQAESKRSGATACEASAGSKAKLNLIARSARRVEKKSNPRWCGIEQSERRSFKRSDLIVVRGGDGSDLKTRVNWQSGRLVLGINYGSLGYLTDFDRGKSGPLERFRGNYEMTAA